jgi:hypothetical protein
MNTEMKIKKLSGAVVDYRGKRNGVGGPWIVKPLPGAKARVVKWLGELGRDADADLKRIDGFKDVREFWAYLGEIRKAQQTTCNLQPSNLQLSTAGGAS